MFQSFVFSGLAAMTVKARDFVRRWSTQVVARYFNVVLCCRQQTPHRAYLLVCVCVGLFVPFSLFFGLHPFLRANVKLLKTLEIYVVFKIAK